MLVPVQGGVANLQKRNRQIHDQMEQLAMVEIPKVYIFNVSRREFRNRVGAGKSYNIPACPKGERYSEPVEVPTLCLSEIDLADGGNNMGVVINSGLAGIVGGQRKPGVANDIIGTDSSSPGLSLNTTNLEWFGVFASMNSTPSDAEILEANYKLRQYMDLAYATGAELVQAGKDVPMIDRPIYNEAAEVLGRKLFWGSLDHTLDVCPECGEDIRKGVNFCKHCHLTIDPASVSARAKKRAKANKEENDEQAAS